jgi:predicted nucleotidyltransferase
MNVLGFQEACSSAEWVRILDRPEVDVPVATPVGMIVLKLMAWVGRDRVARRKDALDIAYLLSSYESIREVQDALYSLEFAHVMNRYDWDITQAAAHLLGEKAKDIAQTLTKDEIGRLARGELEGRALDRLVEEMCEHIDVEHDRNQQLLAAFLAGFGVAV